jgi:hypothetical protein
MGTSKYTDPAWWAFAIGAVLVIVVAIFVLKHHAA